MSKYRVYGIAIILLGIAGLLFWIVSFLEGSSGEMMRGIGVEIVGALVTALGVIGLDRLFTDPDEDIVALQEQIQEQSRKIDALQAQLHITVCQHTGIETRNPDAKVII